MSWLDEEKGLLFFGRRMAEDIALPHADDRNRRRVAREERAPPLDGLVTVFPEGDAGSADGQVVLLRVPTDKLQPIAGRESWTPSGLATTR